LILFALQSAQIITFPTEQENLQGLIRPPPGFDKEAFKNSWDIEASKFQVILEADKAATDSNKLFIFLHLFLIDLQCRLGFSF